MLDAATALASVSTCPVDTGFPDDDGDDVCDVADLCTNVAGARDFLSSPRPRLQLAGVNANTTPGDDKLVLQGEARLPGTGSFASVDPRTDGLRLVLRAASGSTRLDLVLPPEPFGSHGPRGWLAVGTPVKTWRWLDRTSTPLGAIYKAEVTDRAKRSPGQVKLQVLGKAATYPVVATDAPLEAIVVLGGATEAAAGLCVESAFEPGDCATNRRGDQLTCRGGR